MRDRAWKVRPQYVRHHRLEADPAESARYASTPTWQNAAQWLKALDLAIADRKMRADRVANLRAVAEELLSVADYPTGRGVAISVDTLAARLHLSRKTVGRRCADLEEMGLLALIKRGGLTTVRRRVEIKRATGRWVNRIPSLRAMSVPKALAERLSVPAPGPLGPGHNPQVSNTNQARKRATKGSAQTNPRPRSLRLLRLARRIDRNMPWILAKPKADDPLGRSYHIGTIANILERCGIDRGWTYLDIREAIDQWHARQKRTPLGSKAENRVAWFSWALRQATRDGAETAVQREDRLVREDMQRETRLDREERERTRREEARRREAEAAERRRVAPEVARDIMGPAKAAVAAARARREAEREARAATPLSVLLAGKA